ncbi:MAG: hypothetical protein QG671_389 [Actinomycetota bacterium]|nr:hypothetical protein [Actinomycetota bacterium]
MAVEPFFLAWQVDPQLDSVEPSAAVDEFGGRGFDVQDSGARRHPLGGAVGDQPAAAMRILMCEPAVDHVGDRLESAVRMPVGSAGLTRFIVHLAHLVHVNEWVQISGTHPGEGPDHRESLPLVSAGPGVDRSHGPLDVGGSGRAQSGQGQGVCSYSWHTPINRTAVRFIPFLVGIA